MLSRTREKVESDTADGEGRASKDVEGKKKAGRRSRVLCCTTLEKWRNL